MGGPNNTDLTMFGTADINIIPSIHLKFAIIMLSLFCKSNKGSAVFDMRRIGEHCFVYVYKPLTFIDSMKFCQDLGGQLAGIDNDDTQRKVTNFTAQIATTNESFWISLVYWDAIEKWIWLNGQGLRYTDHFDHDRYGNCVVMKAQTGSWNNIKCTQERPFLCKIAWQETKNDSHCPEGCAPNVTNTTTMPNISTTANYSQGGEVTNGFQSHEENGLEKDFIMFLVLASLLGVSFLVNVVFLVRCCCSSLKRRKHYKESSSHAPPVQTNPSLDHQNASSSKASTRRALPVVKIDADDIPLESSDTAQQKGKAPGVSKSSPRKIENTRKDSFQMFSNVIYNGDIVDNIDSNSNCSSTMPMTPSKKFSFKDDDNAYDLPLTPTSGSYSFKRSLDETAFPNTALVENGRNNSTNLEPEESFYCNDSPIDVIPEEDPSLYEAPDEMFYENTEFN